MVNLTSLINKINLMPNSKAKAIEICLVFSYLNFYIESKQISEDEAKEYTLSLNESEVFLKHYVHQEKNQVLALLNSSSELNDMYENILTHANKYNLFTVPLPNNINIKKLFSYAKDFMSFMGNDVINLFNKLVDNDLVYETDIANYGGKCYRLDGNTSGIIIRFDTIPFYKIFAIVHEMGHAYFHYLGRGVPTLMRSNLANESMPRIFEHLFLEYLRNNYLIDHNTLDLYERFLFMHELSITNSVYIVNKLLIDEKIPADFHLENITFKLDQKDYNNLSIINPKYNKEQDFMGFIYNYYAYAFLLAMVMKERFSKDELETRKFIKDFPSYARELNASELINLYDKTEYINSTNKNTSRVFSKTIYKK